MEAVSLSVGRKTPLYFGKSILAMQKVDRVESFCKVPIEEALSVTRSFGQSPDAPHNYLEGFPQFYVVEKSLNSELSVNQVIFMSSSGTIADSIAYNSYVITSMDYCDLGQPSSLTVESLRFNDGGDQCLQSPFPRGDVTTIHVTSAQCLFVLNDACTKLLQRRRYLDLTSENIVSDLEQLRSRHAFIMSIVEDSLPYSNAQFNALFDYFRQYQLINAYILALLQPPTASSAAPYDTKELAMEITNLSNTNSPARKPSHVSENAQLSQLEECLMFWQSVSRDCILTVIEVLPIKPMLPTRDFAAINTLLLGCEDSLEQICSCIKRNSMKEMVVRFRDLSEDWWRETITEPFRLSSFVTNTARQDWKSNSPYMRNKRFSPGIIYCLSTVRETWWYIKRFTEVEAKLTLGSSAVSQPLIVANYISVVFKALTVSLHEVIKVYSWIVCSRTRVTQWQFDVHYTIYTTINTLLSFDQFVRSMASNEDECMAVYDLLRNDLRQVYFSIWLLEIMLYLSKHNDPLQVQTILSLLDLRNKESDTVEWLLLQSKLRATSVWKQQLEAFDSVSLQSPPLPDALQYPFAADTVALCGLAPLLSFSLCSQLEKDVFQKELGANAENHLIAAREVLFQRIVFRPVIDFTDSAESGMTVLMAVSSFGRELLGVSYYDLFKLHRLEMIDNDYPPLTKEQEAFRKVFLLSK